MTLTIGLGMFRVSEYDEVGEEASDPRPRLGESFCFVNRNEMSSWLRLSALVCSV